MHLQSKTRQKLVPSKTLQRMAAMAGRGMGHRTRLYSLVNWWAGGKGERSVHRCMGVRSSCVCKCTGDHEGIYTCAHGHTHCTVRLACGGNVERVGVPIHLQGLPSGIIPASHSHFPAWALVLALSLLKYIMLANLLNFFVFLCPLTKWG